METLEALQRESRERLHPLLTNPSWLVLRRRREIFRKWLAQMEGRNLDVLDIGGRVQPYRPLLQDRLHHYLAVDVRATPLVDVVGRGEQIPLASEQFDLVICTQVLQYVFEPAAAIAEIYRVLKPGGWLLLSVPAIGVRDSDGEFWRFLPASLRQFLRSFHEVEIVPEGGSIIGFFRTINAGLNLFFPHPLIRSGLRWTLFPLVNLSGELLDRVVPSHNDEFSANYSVCARK